MASAIHIIGKLLNPIPQYVVGCLPAIAIVGESPKKSFPEKLAWVLRCLGCPFTGLLYSCNVGTNKVNLCIYWLSSNHFLLQPKASEKPQVQAQPEDQEQQVQAQPEDQEQQDQEQQDQAQPQVQLKQLSHKPIGIYTHKVSHGEKKKIKPYIKRCTARASVLERLSSLVSVYYIGVGVIAGISRVTGPFSCEDWPFIPLLLSWTFPAVFKRVISGTLVVKDPNKEFAQEKVQIIMVERNGWHKPFTVTLVALVSVAYPWITVLLAIYTPPIGYFCRSKFITVFCSIWSFNSAFAYINHLTKLDDGDGNSFYNKVINTWFCLCGFAVAFFLSVLALFSNNIEWWGIFNDPDCVTTCNI